MTVEEIQDLVEAQLNATDLPDVAHAYIIYRQRRAELRAAKALVGVRDELKLSLAAVTVLSDRTAPTHNLGTGDGGNPLDKLQNVLDEGDATGSSSEQPPQRADDVSGFSRPDRTNH